MKPYALVVVMGCGTPSARDPQPAVTVAMEEPSSEPAAALGPAEASVQSVEPRPPDELIGKLVTTKGAQPLIRGHLLSSEVLASYLGEDWRSLQGLRVRVRGEKYVHVCEPEAQCLRDGAIPQMRHVISVDVCETCASTPANIKTVPCSVSEDDIAECMATCNEESKRCDAGAGGDRGRLKRCGSKRVGCRSSCKMRGEACL